MSGKIRRFVGILRTGTSILVEMMPVAWLESFTVRVEGSLMRSVYDLDSMKSMVDVRCGPVAEWIALDDIIAERDAAKNEAALSEMALEGQTAQLKEAVDENLKRALAAEGMIREAYEAIDGRLGGGDTTPRAMADKIVTACHQLAEIADTMPEYDPVDLARGIKTRVWGKP